MKIKNIYKRSAYKRAAFSIMITAVYIFGASIGLPDVNTSSLSQFINSSPNMSIAMSVIGFSVDKFSAFSLGIGPWMAALILWRVLTITKAFNIQSLTTKQSYVVKYTISMAVGIIQGIGVLYQVDFKNKSLGNYAVMLIILIAGLALLIWLGNLNMRFGFGGSMIVMLATMSRAAINKIIPKLMLQKWNFIAILTVILTIVAIYYYTKLIIFVFNAQLRLPVMHIMLDNSFKDVSYMPISINPAGGMPFIYAFTMVTLPQYIFSIIKIFHPKNVNIDKLSNYLQIDHIGGVIFFLIVLVALTYGFTFVNIDNKEVAEGMQKSGDYFLNVYPGKNTEKYLGDILIRLATFGSLFNVLIMGGPLVISLYAKSFSVGYQFISIWIMWVMMLQAVVTQFAALYNTDKYDEFVKV